MKFELNAISIWEPGQRKDEAGNPHQEDSLIPAHGHLSADDRLFIVCDGMGGHEAGEVASALVCEAMSTSIYQDCRDPEGAFPPVTFSRALRAAYDALDQMPCGDERKPGTTLAFLKLHGGGATIAHIGDSRVYHIRPGRTGAETRILFQTSDHSLVNELIKVGEMTEEQARTSKQRNIITRAMQPHLSPRPEAELHTVTDIRKGDYFYLCSDGMLEQTDSAALCEIFSEAGGNLAQKAEILTRATENNKDNHTGILVEITGVKDPAAPQQAAPAPSAPKASESPRNLASQPLAPQVSRRIPPVIWIAAAAVVLIIALAVWFFTGRDKQEDKPVQTPSEQVSADAPQPQTSEAVSTPQATAAPQAPAQARQEIKEQPQEQAKEQEHAAEEPVLREPKQIAPAQKNNDNQSKQSNSGNSKEQKPDKNSLSEPAK